MNLKVGDKVVKAKNANEDYYSKELGINTKYEVERIDYYRGIYYIKLWYYIYPINAAYLIKVNV